METIDQGIELLTGLEAGERDAEGGYPEASFNRRVEDRLSELARTLQLFSGPAAGPETPADDAEGE